MSFSNIAEISKGAENHWAGSNYVLAQNAYLSASFSPWKSLTILKKLIPGSKTCIVMQKGQNCPLASHINRGGPCRIGRRERFYPLPSPSHKSAILPPSTAYSWWSKLWLTKAYSNIHFDSLQDATSLPSCLQAAIYELCNLPSLAFTSDIALASSKNAVNSIDSPGTTGSRHPKPIQILYSSDYFCFDLSEQLPMHR